MNISLAHRCTKPRILIVTGGYFPGTRYGGVSTSRYNFAMAMQDIYDVYIVTTNHDYGSTEVYSQIDESWNRRPEASVLYISDNEFNHDKFANIIKEIEPDIIYTSGTITSLFNINSHVFSAARSLQVPVINTPDGDLCDGALRIKPVKKLLALAVARMRGSFKGVRFQTTSNEETKNLQRWLGVPKTDITCLENLPFLPARMARQPKEDGVLRCVFSSRICRIKNPEYAVRVVIEAARERSDLQFCLDLFGPAEDRACLDACRAAIADAPKNATIEYRGALKPDDARCIAGQYDLMLLPTQSENHGYAIEEALLCGCPVLISAGTTPWDDVDGLAGYAEPLEEPRRFARRIAEVAAMTAAEYQEFAGGVLPYAEDKVSFSTLREQYLAMLASAECSVRNGLE